MTNSLTSQDTLEITRLAGLGDGIGSHNGKPVFVPKSCAGDVLRVNFTQETVEFYRGEIDSVVTPGPERVPAPCPHFSACGGCSLQQLSQASYQAFKRDVVVQALGYSGFADIQPEMHFLPPASRRRADFKILNGSLAYSGMRSHDLVAIKTCLILEPALQALIEPLNAFLPKLPRFKTVSFTSADSGIDIRFTLLPTALPLPETEQKMLQTFAEHYNVGRIMLDDGKRIIPFIVRTPITMQLGEHKVPLPPRAFLQATKQAQTLMTEFALKHLRTSQKVVDLFAGMGTYTFPLSRFGKVVAVEGDKHMVESSKYISKSVEIKRRDLFLEPLTVTQLNKFDGAIINPPRAGAKNQIEQLAGSKIKTIVMISCNPATWSRDAKTLKNAGFHLEKLTAIDQFVYSGHVEIASVFRR